MQKLLQQKGTDLTICAEVGRVESPETNEKENTTMQTDYSGVC